MTIFLFILWLISGGVGIYIQIRHAWANYPGSPTWFIARFGSTFLNGVLLGTLLFLRDIGGLRLVIVAILCGVVFGTLFTWLSPHKLKELIPAHDVLDATELKGK